MNNITKEERVLRVINRKNVDYLPSNIIFADRSREKDLSKAFGLDSVDDLDDYLENHLHLTLTYQDKPIFFRDDIEEMERLHKLNFCKPDWENKMVYDCWGLGIRTKVGSLFIGFHPLQGKATKEHIKYMPQNVSENVLFAKNIETAVKLWEPPDANTDHNLDDWKEAIKKYSGKYLVWPSGYFGIYERAYSLMGWNEFMLYIASNASLVEELLDKVTDYKIQHAKNIVKLGFKIAHHGDDLGQQFGTFFSKDMFRKIFKPRLKKIWDIFNNAGLPIMMHTCGNVVEFLPDLIDIGLKILEPVQPCMDLSYLKKEFGKDLIFFGGIDTQKLPYITPEETRVLTRNVIRTLGKGGGMIIAPSQELMNDIPIANVKALVETIKEERVKVLDL